MYRKTILLLSDATGSTLCLLVQLSVEQCLCGCFGDVLMKAMTDIKEGIKQAPLCGYSTMNCLDLAACISASFNVTETD